VIALGANPARWLATMARFATVALGLAAVGWGIYVGPMAWRQAPMAPMAVKIIGGEAFAPAVLEDFVAGTRPAGWQGVCQPVVLRTLAVIRLRFAELAIADGDRQTIARSQSDLDAALRRSLSCAPTDPLLWFALFWLQNNVRGLQEDNFRPLRMSYRLGANEGWLALRRNRFALAIYPALPDDLKQQATDEFVQLVNSDFITDAADILAGPGTPVRDTLLSRLRGMDSLKLRFLSRLLADKGIEDAFPEFDTLSRLRRQ
jgi:hypothetical protein